MSRASEVRPLGDVRAARAAMEAATREALLAAAAVVLSEEGPSALTVRRVAEAVNASTKTIYTHFGGKDGLLEALYLHSFAGLARAFQSHGDKSDPTLRVEGMISAYRAFALGEPALYNVMFGDLGRAWEAPLESRRQAWTTFETMREAVRLCVGPRRATEAGRITYLLWATMHGVLSLEMRKLIGGADDGEQIYHLAVNAVREAHGLARPS
jgi:AcrR family transcriptional regulator